MTYYKIIPVSTYDRSIFDTIDFVAKESGILENTLLNVSGFGDDGDSLEYIMYPPTTYFSIEHLVMTRLNAFLKEHNIHIRISRPMVRRSEYAVSDKTKSSRSRILGWW